MSSTDFSWQRIRIEYMHISKFISQAVFIGRHSLASFQGAFTLMEIMIVFTIFVVDRVPHLSLRLQSY